MRRHPQAQVDRSAAANEDSYPGRVTPFGADACDGGADLIRQALAAGLVDELTIIIAPVTLDAGKRLFDGFGKSLELEHLGIRQSPFATFIEYRVKK
jgi:hypothetical protein